MKSYNYVGEFITAAYNKLAKIGDKLAINAPSITT
jgi:hypothetical protein